MGVPKSCGILTSEELAITESSAVDLVSQLAAGKLTSVAVTTAFCKRAAIAHQLVSILIPIPTQDDSLMNVLAQLYIGVLP